MSRLAAATAALLLLPGCHRLLPGSARCSAHGGREWRELRSRHFVVDTDLDRPAAAALVADLERIQGLVTAALVSEPREIPGYVRVVAPAREETFWALLPPLVIGYFEINRMGEPTVFLHPEALRRDPEVIAHELAHHFAWYFFPRQPRWFAEGLAQFVQTVASEAPIRHAAGVVPRLRADGLRDVDQVPVRDLLRWRGPHDEGLFQLWSWVLYHWLWNQRSRQLADFQRRIGSAEDPASAWVAAFPDLDPADPKALRKLDAVLDEHRRHGELVYYQVNVEADAAFTEARLPPADVHVLLMGVRRYVSREDLRAALADDAHHPVAVALRAARGGEAAALRGAVAAHPQDWRGWFLLGAELRDEADAGEREAALREAVALNPSSALALDALAESLVGRGRAEEALPFSRRAVELAPSSPDLLETLARIAAELGACEEAVSLQRRAIDTAPGARGDALRERLRALEAGCAGRGAGAPAR